MRSFTAVVGWLLVSLSVIILGFGGYLVAALGNEYGFELALAPIGVLTLLLAALPAVLARRLLATSRVRRTDRRTDAVPM